MMVLDIFWLPLRNFRTHQGFLIVSLMEMAMCKYTEQFADLLLRIFTYARSEPASQNRTKV